MAASGYCILVPIEALVAERRSHPELMADEAPRVAPW